MKRSLLAVLVLLSFSISAGAAQVVIGTHDGRTTTLDLPDNGDTADVIIELRDQPLFVRGGTGLHAASSAMQEFDDRFAQLARDLGGTARIHRRFERLYSGASVTVPRKDLARIARLSYVAAIHSDGVVHTMAPRHPERSRGTWAGGGAPPAPTDNITKIKADQVWTTYGTRGKGVVVAVIDTGVDYTHPALGGGFGPHARVIGGYDFVNNDTDPMDDNGHGTHVAGIIGANSDTIVGVAPEVSFLAYKVLGASGSGKDSDVIAGIERAVDPNDDGDPSDHADVINMSLGGSGNADSPGSVAAENAVAAGVVVAIAAGNSGGFYSLGAPGSAPSAITVGASDLNDQIAIFSSGGPAVPLAIKPEVVAPGVNILSLAPHGGTAVHSGTSMASPHIAGVAALLRALHPKWPAGEVKSAIVTTAEVLNKDVMSEGGGRVDALRAAGNDAYVFPPVVTFGRVLPKQEEWTTSSTVRLSNDAGQERTFTASAIVERDGISIAVDPPSVTLKANETRDVTVTVTVRNAAVPFPMEGSLALAGSVVFDGGASPVHVRWAFIKSAHVTIIGDANTASYYLAATDGTTFEVGFIDHTAKNFEFFVPPGRYDALQMLSDGRDGYPTTRLTFADRRTIDDESTYMFDPSLPTPVITKMKRDSQGRTFGEIGSAPGGFLDAFTLLYPPESKGVEFIATIIQNNSGKDNRLFSTPPPDGFRIGGVEVAWDTKAAPSLYVAQYGPSADLTTLDDPIDASAWVHVPVRLAIPPNVQNPTIQFGPALLWRDPLFAQVYYMQPQRIPVGGLPSWSGDVYMTREGESRLTGAAILKLLGDYATYKGFTAIDTRTIRARSDGVTTWPYFTDGPATYVAAPGELLAFGDDLPHPEPGVAFMNGAFGAGVSWAGALGEARMSDTYAGTATLRDANGAVIASGASFFSQLELPAPGVYTYELKKSFGKAEATVLSTIDTTRSDAVAPTFRSMTIVDAGGHLSTSFAAASTASLHFGAMDAAPAGGLAVQYTLVKKANVSWSPHGLNDWRALQTSVEAEELVNSLEEAMALGHAAVGTAFVTDLGPITRSRGDVDLRVRIEDESGNATEYTLAPALTVRDARRRTAGK